MKLHPSRLFDIFKKNKINFFCGVPDSLLKDFINLIDEKVDSNNHIITANEGNAIALATGYHLKTRKIGLVYLQNSGLGNCINPLTSLTDSKVYSIPMVLLIGWRGALGSKDEPQHFRQGKILEDQLKILEIKYLILENRDKINSKLTKLIKYSVKKNVPVAILVKKETFKNYEPNPIKSKFTLSKKDFLENFIPKINKKDTVLCTTGMISRSVIKFLTEKKINGKNFFYNVGSMGHLSSIALGIALNKKNNVYCLDGDGSFLMHLGSLAIIGSMCLRNFKYILLNNGCHQSVGGQSTVSLNIDIKKIAEGFGFKYTKVSKGSRILNKELSKFFSIKNSGFLEILVNDGDEGNLPRPNKSLIKYKNDFIESF